MMTSPKKRKFGLTQTLVIAIVVLIVAGSATAAFIGQLSPTSPPAHNSSPTPSATSSTIPNPSSTQAPTPTRTPTTPTPTNAPTPTSSPAPSPSPSVYTHTVDWTTMANGSKDLWNVTTTDPYTVILNDSMTVTSGEQWLQIFCYNSTNNSYYDTSWGMAFVNSTYFMHFYGNMQDIEYDNCSNGVVTVVVDSNSITFIGTSTYTNYVDFQNLAQIQTSNGDGDFNSQELDVTLTTS